MPEVHQTRDQVPSNQEGAEKDAAEQLRTSVSAKDMQDYQRSGQKPNPANPVVQPMEVVDNEKVQTKKETTQSQDCRPNPIASLTEFNVGAQALFTRIDENGNGYLSQRELRRAVENRQFQGEDAQILAGLYRGRKGIAGLSNDQWFSETQISMGDLAKLNGQQERLSRVNQASQVADWSDKGDNFAKIDANGNGFINRAEIDKALQNDQLSQLERTSLEHMRNNYREMQKAHNDDLFADWRGIGRKDIIMFKENERSGYKAVEEAMEVSARTFESQKRQTSRELYGELAPKDAIRMDAIHQGTIGNCYFGAALSTLAHSNPEAIRKMIRDNNDGSYTVTFPGDPKHPVKVNAPTEAELGLFNGGDKYGTWAGVMERAYGKYRLETDRRPELFESRRTYAEGGDGGGSSEQVLRLLTGKEQVHHEMNKTSAADVVKELDAAIRAKRTVVVSSLSKEGELNTTPDGYQRDHAYSVIGFERNGDDDGVVIMRNPHGRGENSTMGTFKISVAQFKKNFRDFGVARN